MQGVEAEDLVGLEVLQRQDHADVERRLVRPLDEELRLGGRGEDDVQLLPAAAERVGPQAVPAAQHGEEIVGEIRAEDRVRLVDRQHAWRVQRLQDLPLDVAGAVLRVGEPVVPELVDRVGELELLGDRRGESPEEEIGVRLRLFVDQLEVQQRDLLADVERRLSPCASAASSCPSAAGP